MRNRRASVWECCRVAFVGTATVIAMAPAATAQDRWTNHVDAGMVNDAVLHNGRVLCASMGGLLEYNPDTRTFRQFTNAHGLTSNALTAIVIGNDGAIYLGTDDIGIAKMRASGNTLRLEKAWTAQIDGISSNRITCMSLHGNSIVYGSMDGMGSIVNGFATSPIYASDGLPADHIEDVASIGGLVWVATENGIVTLSSLGIITPVPGATISARALATTGSMVYVGGDDGVHTRALSDTIWSPMGLQGTRVDAILHDGTTLWATTRVKVHRYDGSSWPFARLDNISLSYKLGFAAVSLPALVVLPSGTAFASLGQFLEARGATLIEVEPGTAPIDSASLAVRAPNSPGGANLVRLSFDPTEGALWASFFTFYVGKLRPDGTWLNYNSSIPAGDSVSAQFANLTCLADSRGDKWFSTLGLRLDRLSDQRDASYTNDTWQRITVGSGGGEGLNSNRLQRAVEDPAGQVWFLSDTDPLSPGMFGVSVYNAALDEWLRINPSTASGMSSGDVTDVAFGPSVVYLAYRDLGVQRVLLGGDGYSWSNLEAVRLQPGAWGPPTRLGTDLRGATKANVLELADELTVWIGTDNGAFRWATPGGIAHVPAYTGLVPGLLGPEVNDLAIDLNGDLWVATSAGLNRVTRDDLNDIAAFSTPAEYQRSLSQLNYPLNVISPLVHEKCLSLAIHPGKERLYIGTLRGLSVYEYAEVAPDEVDLSTVYLYPNPVYGRKGHNDVRIGALLGHVDVEIFNMEGELVASSEAEVEGDVIWDLTTREGFVAASGTYLVRIRSETGVITRTIAVVR